MHVEPVDPRDVSQEVTDPAYRVLVWTGAGRCEEFELTSTDVAGARDWARARGRHPDTTYSLWVVVPGDRPGTRTAIRLEGWDPTADDAHRPPWAATARSERGRPAAGAPDGQDAK